MNILLKLKKKMRDFNSFESQVSMCIGHLATDDLKNYDPHVHYIEVKKSFLSKKVTVVIYCGRPGLIIGHHGRTHDKLKYMISESIKRPVEISFVEYEPVRIPMYDCD